MGDSVQGSGEISQSQEIARQFFNEVASDVKGLLVAFQRLPGLGVAKHAGNIDQREGDVSLGLEVVG